MPVDKVDLLPKVLLLLQARDVRIELTNLAHEAAPYGGGLKKRVADYAKSFRSWTERGSSRWHATPRAHRRFRMMND
jgi:hypothetical protein